MDTLRSWPRNFPDTSKTSVHACTVTSRTLAPFAKCTTRGGFGLMTSFGDVHKVYLQRSHVCESRVSDNVKQRARE